MATWTNIKIPERYDDRRLQALTIETLNFEIMQKDKLISSLFTELENIFDSLKENKKITLKLGKETIVAILDESAGE